jgi:hypothetical protein
LRETCHALFEQRPLHVRSGGNGMLLNRNSWVLAAGLTLAAAPAFAQSQTAQSAMIDVTLDQTAYQIEGTITWTFQRGTHNEPGTAMAAFSNAVLSGPTVTCSGSGTNCDLANQPAAPVPPPADEVKLQQHAQGQRCTFFFGGTLATGGYDRSSVINGVNGKGNWSFTWTYAITPTTAVVAAGTAWTSEETGGTVDVGFSGFVASESFLKQSAKSKYSFTMIEGGVTRARNMFATLQVPDPNNVGGWLTVNTPVDLNDVDTDGDTVLDGVAIVAATVDFTYGANAGTFGNSAVFPALHTGAAGAKVPNGVVNILTGASDGSPADNFAGNNNDLASGNVHKALFASLFAGLTEDGSYRVLISGALKGNSSAGDLGFSIGSSLVQIGGCVAQ